MLQSSWRPPRTLAHPPLPPPSAHPLPRRLWARASTAFRTGASATRMPLPMPRLRSSSFSTSWLCSLAGRLPLLDEQRRRVLAIATALGM